MNDTETKIETIKKLKLVISKTKEKRHRFQVLSNVYQFNGLFECYKIKKLYHKTHAD